MTVSQFGNFKSTRPKMTIMDKTFDFSNFLAKDMITTDAPEISETNTISQESIRKGLLKTIVMAGNGVFEMVDSKYGFSIKNQGGKYPGLGAAYQSLNDGMFITHNEGPKIPREAIETVIEWYRRITEKNGQEAQVVFYNNEFNYDTITNDDGDEYVISEIPGVHFWTDKLFSYTPLQTNSATLTQVHSTDEWYDVFNRKLGLYVETHSHNSMDAFASGEDEANSGNDGFQLVFGRLNTQNPIMYSWATMNEIMKKGLSEEELAFILDGESETSYDGVNNKLVFDRDKLEFNEDLFAEWDAQIKPAVRTYYQAPAFNTGVVAGTVQTHTTGYSAYTSQYARLSTPVELQMVTEEVDKFLELEDKTYSVDEVLDLVSRAFVTGYKTKITHPYVNGVNKDNVITSVQNAVMSELNAE